MAGPPLRRKASGSLAGAAQQNPDAMQTEREPLKVLLVEDDPNDELIIRQCLQRSRFFDCVITSANDMQSAKFLAKSAEFDVMLLDFWVKAEDSLSILARSADRAFHAPAVVVSSLDMTDVQAQSLDAGALAYLHKNDLSASSLDATLRTLLHTSGKQSRLQRTLNERASSAKTQRDNASEMANQMLDTLTTVNGIADALSQLQANSNDGPISGTYSTLIKDSSQRLMSALQQHLSGADQKERFAHLQYQQGCLVTAAEAAICEMEKRCAAKHQDIDLIATAETLPADFDAAALHQILVNLLSNAHKFSAIGAPIRITIDEDGPQAKITVVDQGVGMTPSAIAGALQQANDVGGLAISRLIAEMHGGSIEIESFPDWGTSVVLRLPRRRPTLN